MNKRRVEVLVFDGCPNLEATVECTRQAIARTGVPADLHIVQVGSDEEAARLGFLGSPTVRVDGVDVEPATAAREDFGLQCRVYAIDGRIQGAPPTRWIVNALRGEGPRTGDMTCR
jgi:hypothetical protein